MKKSILSALALFGAMQPSGHAFTLDAAGYEGGEVARYPLAVFVSGYGEVVLEAGGGLPVVVGSAYGNGRGFSGASLRFDVKDSLKLASNGASGGFGVSPLKKPALAEETVGEEEEDGVKVGEETSTEGEGRTGVWNSIPEPASAALGLIGVLLLLLGRRR